MSRAEHEPTGPFPTLGIYRPLLCDTRLTPSLVAGDAIVK